MKWRFLASSILIMLSVSRLSTAAPTKGLQMNTDSGLVVESVKEESALDKAGLQPGDILFSYQRLPKPPANPNPAFGVLRSVVDWDELVVNQAPRGTVRFHGKRGANPIEFEVSGGSWDAKIRPFLFGSELDSYQQSRRAVATGDLKQSEALLLQVSRETGRDSLTCWLLIRSGEDWTLARRWQEAQNAYLRALGSASCRTQEHLLIWDALGHIKEEENRIAEAEQYYRKTLKHRAASRELSLGLAKSYANLARCAWSRMDFASAESGDRRVFHIRERLAPESLDLAKTLFNLGALKLARRDLKAAEVFIVRGLRISEAVDPESLFTAGALSNLGIIAEQRGQIEAAIEHQTRALDIRKKKAPGSTAVATSLNALGSAFFEKRRLDEAQNYYQRAFQLVKNLDTEKDLAGSLLGNLGLICLYRYELDEAEDYLLQAISLKRSIAPDNLHSVNILNLLARIQIYREHWDRAKKYLTETLRIARREAPGTMEEADVLSDLGLLAFRTNHLDLARRYYRRSLFIVEKQAPKSLSAASNLFNLGGIAQRQGRKDEAISLLNSALRIEEKVAPGSTVTAQTLYQLGAIYRDLNRPLDSVEFLSRSLEDLESQIPLLGGTLDARSQYRENNAQLFHELIDLLVELKRPLDALQVLEQSHGQELLEMLAQRNLPPPPANLDKEYNRIQRRLLEARQLRTRKNLDSLLSALRQSWIKREEAIEAIQRDHPPTRPVPHPTLLDLASLQRAIDPGTLVLSFSIGKSRSYLFAYSTDTALETFPINVGEVELRRQIDEFRNLIFQTRAETAPTLGRQTLLRQVGAELYSILLRAVAARIHSSQRVMIIPDGPLHILPWAALVRENESATDLAQRYFGEWKPLHIALSGTVYAEIRRSREHQPERMEKTSPATLIAAFGAPFFPRSLVASGQVIDNLKVRSMAEHGFDFSPLPAARDEVQRIVQLFPGKTKAYLDTEAREESVKSLPHDTRILHFATHATLDEFFPLNSAVVLSIPENFEESQDDGLLQAWEIFEQVRLDADLVVLSACESGLGKEMGGEGLIGLTRAFQYAGARSVMASLWKISDRTTAELMVRFYKHLKDGLPKDEALRAAQVELIQGSIQVKNEKGEVETIDASAPYYWAAFQIYGDWQ
ncbi:MAG TPA: CHAT domain-containing protein [Thermoanaerobaculia bacterium]|nr:CHAT domain-containing protein [Thermoanaerobaculia bacterium]